MKKNRFYVFPMTAGLFVAVLLSGCVLATPDSSSNGSLFSSVPSSSEFSSIVSSSMNYSGPLSFDVASDGRTASVAACDKRATEAVVPENYQGVVVTSIGDRAFQSCSALSSLSIPESITSFGISSFFDCPALTNLQIPSGVRTIYSMEFALCSSLSTMVLPDGLITLAEMSFLSCSSLSSVIIPLSVIALGYDAFSNCATDLKIYCIGTSLDGVTLGRNWDGGYPHYFYSEVEKIGCWHFAADGTPVVW